MLPLPDKVEMIQRGITSDGIPKKSVNGFIICDKTCVPPDDISIDTARDSAVSVGKRFAVCESAFFAPSRKISNTGSRFINAYTTVAVTVKGKRRF